TGRHPRVLIADDNPDDRALAARQVRRELGEVEVVEIGTPEALDGALDDGGFDLLLTDYHLRWTTGLELLRTVKARWPERPVVMHTGTGSEEIAVEALKAGLDDYVLKGAEREHRLGAVVRGAIERARERAERRVVEADLEREIAARQAVAASLGRLRRGSTAEDTAALVAAEVRAAMSLAVVAIYAFVDDPDGPAAIALGVEPHYGAPVPVGGRLKADRAAYLHERAATGPWVEEWRELRATSDYIEAWRKLGFETGAYVPLRSGDSVIGVLIAGTHGVSLESWARQLPTFVEYGAVAAALLAPAIEQLRADEDIAATISRVIDRREFTPVFQPVVELGSGAVVGYEALTRFTDGTRPDLRFADAVAVGMGADLERATLGTAFEAAGPLPASAWLSVNVSPSVILDGQTLPALLDRWAWLTVLEVTEHEPIGDYEAFRHALAALGPRARLAVDDAGAGFSGLRHILELRPQFVKLDIELVRNVDRDPARQALIAGMAHFAAQADVTLLAEGVETDAERRSLRTLGVSLGQGFLFGRPAPAEELARPSARASLLAPR
ncbi:MAG TPA: EAL domain-containing protein, partial [Candidatus Limnocylindrales bacterium]|nr:EAL domain-containing protein [Candidatus Limnocylindrales bacterium]